MPQIIQAALVVLIAGVAAAAISCLFSVGHYFEALANESKARTNSMAYAMPESWNNAGKRVANG